MPRRVYGTVRVGVGTRVSEGCVRVEARAAPRDLPPAEGSSEAATR